MQTKSASFPSVPDNYTVASIVQIYPDNCKQDSLTSDLQSGSIIWAEVRCKVNIQATNISNTSYDV